jgi:23S rRNA (cytosine1962-C5)-methyltransferase
LKTLILSKNGALKIRQNIFELFQKDVESGQSGTFPGEWVLLEDQKKKVTFLAHVYSVLPDKSFLYVHGESGEVAPSEYIKQMLLLAISKRSKFKNYHTNSRLVFGSADKLPGLTIDSYVSKNLIQINSPAYDNHIDLIKEIINDDRCDSLVIVNKKNRLDAGIPVIEGDEVLEDIKVNEGDLELIVFKDNFQKNGYYYDHRENRLRARRIIDELSNTPQTCLDLFSFVGSWGISFLKAGCEKVTFVDQADLNANIMANLELNNFTGRGQFEHGDVFKYLNDSKEKFDLVCSDPPAFAKSKKNKKNAIDGYLKLHAKALKRVNAGGFFIAASCTKYVSLQEFQKTVFEASERAKRSIHLLDIGIQGFDHPFSEFNDNQNYIKYAMYQVE